MTDLTYVIADIHGRSDLLREALAAIVRHGATREHGRRSLVTLGDYVDRGPDSKGVIDLLMHGVRGWNTFCLKGNHEQMVIMAYADRFMGSHYLSWISNGGDATERSYNEFPSINRMSASHLRWIVGLPLIYADTHRVYVHADLDPRYEIHEQKEEILLWSRDMMGQGYRGRHIVVGHTPDARNPRTVKHRTDLDTLAYETGRLAVAVFNDDEPGAPVDFLDIRGDRGIRIIHREAWMD